MRNFPLLASLKEETIEAGTGQQQWRILIYKSGRAEMQYY
jgi:hypothetical protein